MVSGGEHINLTRYDVQNSASVARLHAVPLNESESFFYKILVEMRIIHTTSVVKHINEKSQPEKCSDEAYGMIVIDCVGWPTTCLKLLLQKGLQIVILRVVGRIQDDLLPYEKIWLAETMP